MFVNPPVHYDTMSQRYVLNSQTPVPMPAADNGALTTPNSHPVPSTYPMAATSSMSMVNNPPLRPVWSDAKDMKFWNAVLLEALDRFKATKIEPNGRSKSQYSIRDKNHWDTICETLELARDHYQKAGGPVGWLRRIRRRAADNVAPLSGAVSLASKSVLDNTYSTPVLGAVMVLLDVRCLPSLTAINDT